MNIKITLLVIINISFFGIFESRGHYCGSKVFFNSSYNGDTMIKNDFFIEVKRDKKKMENGQFFTTNKAIRLVKVYNTLHLSNLYNDSENSKLIKEFFIVFKTKYLKKIMYHLRFEIGKNMSLYSMKFDLYLAPGTEIRNKDIITIK